MITQSGVHIQKIGGVAGIPTAMDIAVHSGRLTRFGGSVWSPLLAHLVFVGLLAYKRSGSVVNMIGGFVHDAHEVVTSDVPRPFKCDCMREEQKALDALIYPFFCPIGLDGMDHDLIKQCDGDACDIEAVALGVPGYSQIEIEFADDYKGIKDIHRDNGDLELFLRIKRSPFFIDTISGKSSPGVHNFAYILDLASKGKYELIEKLIEGMGFLK